MVQEQQKKIEELMNMSKNLIDTITSVPQNTDTNRSKRGDKLHKQGKKRSSATTAKAGFTITVTNAMCERKINSNIHSGTTI